jgi:hypothetical protein
MYDAEADGCSGRYRWLLGVRLLPGCVLLQRGWTVQATFSCCCGWSLYKVVQEVPHQCWPLRGLLNTPVSAHRLHSL